MPISLFSSNTRTDALGNAASTGSRFNNLISLPISFIRTRRVSEPTRPSCGSSPVQDWRQNVTPKGPLSKSHISPPLHHHVSRNIPFRDHTRNFRIPPSPGRQAAPGHALPLERGYFICQQCGAHWPAGQPSGCRCSPDLTREPPKLIGGGVEGVGLPQQRERSAREARSPVRRAAGEMRSVPLAYEHNPKLAPHGFSTTSRERSKEARTSQSQVYRRNSDKQQVIDIAAGHSAPSSGPVPNSNAHRHLEHLAFVRQTPAHTPLGHRPSNSYATSSTLVPPPFYEPPIPSARNDRRMSSQRFYRDPAHPAPVPPPKSRKRTTTLPGPGHGPGTGSGMRRARDMFEVPGPSRRHAIYAEDPVSRRSPGSDVQPEPEKTVGWWDVRRERKNSKATAGGPPAAAVWRA